MSQSTNQRPIPDRSVTDPIIAAAIEAHRILGPGLLESAYHGALGHEFDLRGIPYESEVQLPVVYKGQRFNAGYRLDFVVAGQVVLELKAVERTLPVHEAQLLTYLRLSGLRVGLLLNFNVPLLKNGITRRVL